MPYSGSSPIAPGTAGFVAPPVPAGLLGDHHIFFPGLTGSGLRHAVNFAPRSTLERADPSAQTPLGDEEMFCLRWLFREAGLNLNAYRDQSLQRRIPGLLRSLHARSLPEAWSLLRANPGLVQKAMDAMLIGVTSFFRDPQMFDAVRDVAIPALSLRGDEVCIWSAACSDGSELFSLAMLLAESGLLHRARLLGTDCRAGAVMSASRGIFADECLAHVDPGLIRRYFRQREQSWHVLPVIRNRIAWRQADVLGEVEPGKWDIIFCRNLAIYLRPGAVLGLWSRLHGALRIGGYLVTGRAERLLLMRGFRPVGPCVYRREE